jgi:hypothetical protein
MLHYKLTDRQSVGLNPIFSAIYSEPGNCFRPHEYQLE